MGRSIGTLPDAIIKKYQDVEKLFALKISGANMH